MYWQISKTFRSIHMQLSYLILMLSSNKIEAYKTYGGDLMSDQYGSDFMTIVDEDGTEYELEVLTTIDYNGFTYLAVIPATDEKAELSDLEVSILKSIEEDGEPILCAIEDDEELETVYNLIMDELYSEDQE